jgi:hypothetical protein
MATRPANPQPAAPQELTPELIEKIKEYLVASELPPVIYKFVSDQQVIVFRPLYKPDWEEVQDFVDSNTGGVRQDLVDELICQKAICWPGDILEPQKWAVQKAGLQVSLAKMIVARSGFFDEDLDQSSYLRVEPLVAASPAVQPDPALVAELKSNYPWPLKGVTIEGEYYVVRPLTRDEWKALPKQDSGQDADLTACMVATLWSSDYPKKPDFNNRLAGTNRVLAEVIMAASGFMVQPSVEEL